MLSDHKSPSFPRKVGQCEFCGAAILEQILGISVQNDKFKIMIMVGLSLSENIHGD